MATLDALKALTYVSLGGGGNGQLTTTKAVTYLVLGTPLPPPQRIMVRLMAVPQENAT